MLATIKANAADDTPVTVSMTWTLREWRYVVRQMDEAQDGRFEVTKVRSAIRAAVSLMDKHYNIDVHIEP